MANNSKMEDVVVHLLQECNEDETHFITNNNYIMFTISLTNLKSAIVSGVIMGVLAVAAYIIGVGDVFGLDFHKLVNAFALAALVSIVSIIKSFLTTNSGSTVGVQTVEPIVPTV